VEKPTLLLTTKKEQACLTAQSSMYAFGDCRDSLFLLNKSASLENLSPETNTSAHLSIGAACEARYIIRSQSSARAIFRRKSNTCARTAESP